MNDSRRFILSKKNGNVLLEFAKTITKTIQSRYSCNSGRTAVPQITNTPLVHCFFTNQLRSALAGHSPGHVLGFHRHRGVVIVGDRLLSGLPGVLGLS